MRVKSRELGELLEADMTPMIDIVFQLIAFFMVLVNFTQVDQDARVVLPSSVLAKPPEKQPEQALTIQIAKETDSTEFFALIGGEKWKIGDELENILRKERRARRLPASKINVIIRAHRYAKTGLVQEVIELCQKIQFESFRLRVKEDPRRSSFNPTAT
ncbi:MAG: biopolymer transporter ExbD [Planctomycetota bacterium]|nr:biopolymer transporter ExbD [Planctomycetota bacterium]